MQKYINPLIGIIVFYTMWNVTQIILKLILVFYDFDFLASWFTGNFTEQQIALMNNPSIISISNIISAIMIISFFFATKIIPIRNLLNYQNINWKWLGIMTVVFIIVMTLTEHLNTLLPFEDTNKESYEKLSLNVLGVIYLVITGPIIEECIFRGSVLGNLLQNGMNKWYAIVISAIIFSLIHFNPAQYFPCFVFAIVIGYVYAKTQSIIATSILHILNNAIGTILLALGMF